MDRARILIVDDEKDNLRALDRTLRRDFDVTSCEDPKVALSLVEQQEFAVVISDQKMPGMLGTELLQKIALVKPLVSRVILTAYTEIRVMLDAINRAEIYRYVTKPWDNQELNAVVHQAVERYRLQNDNVKLIRTLEGKNKALTEKEQELLRLNEHLETLVDKRTAELRQLNERLNQLAMTDPLTKVFNRRAFFSRFSEEIERCRRYRHPLVVVMVDVDHFKAFNDMEGHVCGDEALRKIAQTLAKNLRKSDILGRYGGEEFVILMPETPIPNAREICERLRATIETTSFEGKQNAAFLTVSIGLSGFPEHGEMTETLIKAADHALYQAKERGRNRVVAG